MIFWPPPADLALSVTGWGSCACPGCSNYSTKSLLLPILHLPLPPRRRAFLRHRRRYHLRKTNSTATCGLRGGEQHGEEDGEDVGGDCVPETELAGGGDGAGASTPHRTCVGGRRRQCVAPTLSASFCDDHLRLRDFTRVIFWSGYA